MAEPGARPVVIGLARARQQWFTDLARWSSGAVAPLDVVKCLTGDEARAVLAVGRPASLLLVDGGLPRWDRDLVDAARAVGTPTVLVADPRARADWEDLGCVAVLPDRFGPEDLLDLLRRHGRADRATDAARRADLDPDPPTGRLIGVTGSGGTGVSTVAMLTAQGLATRSPGPTDVVLVDGARRSSLAAYHDVGDVIPGLPELVDLHRRDRVDPDELRATTFAAPARGYRLVLGQRQARDWVALRPRTLEATLDGLRRAYDDVVVDHDPDVEGEAETGSVDVEDRHALARLVVTSADAVLVVGRSGMHGTQRLVGHLEELVRAGADPGRLVPVVNCAPRSPAERAELTRALHELTAGRGSSPGIHPPVFVPRIRRLEDLHRDAGRLPSGPADRMAAAVGRTAETTAAAAPARAAAGRRIRRGELGASFDHRDHADEVA